ncbi:MAG: bifunctional methylenetetrahydrofolate dehydrogenase/methenyltetrahydrofolate cyclohydrolase, partial [Rickettsiaceae bacterium]|nr:bifunctional methylenetetrahydrofolate dehydrogenase/methenyltetrahydrofolate cyclohydrolase [Rickettsiaceae bacterium]
MLNIIDGKKVAAEFLKTLKIKAQELIDKGTTPKLTIILVGDDPASKLYVKNKQVKAKELGVLVDVVKFSKDAKTDEVLGIIKKLNDDKNNHGIIVQLPISKHMDKQQIIEAIDPKKDVDGFAPINVGRAYLNDSDAFIPCTPLGILHLINTIPSSKNKHVVVIGRSMIVGKPLVNLLLNNDFTVTICHSKTKNLAKIIRSADIVVTAVGSPKKFTEEYFTKGQIVIDVGISEFVAQDGVSS